MASRSLVKLCCSSKLLVVFKPTFKRPHNLRMRVLLFYCSETFTLVDINIAYYFCFRFGAFESFKKLAVDDIGNLRPVDRMLCGLGAGVCEAIFAVTPMETIKVKFINDQRSPNPKFRGFFHGCSVIVKNEGTDVCTLIEKLLT